MTALHAAIAATYVAQVLGCAVFVYAVGWLVTGSSRWRA